MQTEHVIIDRKEARELYRKYKAHVHYSKPIDRECMRAYQLLAQGRLVIKAIESVKVAGLKTEGPDIGFPKLGLCRADALACDCRMDSDGSAMMHPEGYQPRRRGRWSGPVIQSGSLTAWPAGSFEFKGNRRWRATALVPTPPVHLRPQRGLANYHILWEAEWTKVPPYDPYLLRRIGKADMWVVVAMWDLTEVERAALSTRLT